ncbi:MAG: hypothetical protein M0R03_16815 [Novosphingobium sp.]|nr:hypothetical protein [Novosphingobium sp.]
MTNNREKRIYTKSVHLFLALQRTSKQGKKNCIRVVIEDEELDLKILEAKLKIIGGEWCIHKTVNARDVEKSRKWLIKHLIDYPENASFADSAFRTALLQKAHIYGEKRFMLDVDTQDNKKLYDIEPFLIGKIIESYKSPNGWHIITKPFDTREICKLDYVTLLRDGYSYVKTVGENND